MTLRVLRIENPRFEGLWGLRLTEAMAAAGGVQFRKLESAAGERTLTGSSGRRLAAALRRRSDAGEFDDVDLVHAEFGLFDHADFWALQGLTRSRSAPPLVATFHEPSRIVLHPLRLLPAVWRSLPARAAARVFRHLLAPADRAVIRAMTSRLNAGIALTYAGRAALEAWGISNASRLPHGATIPEWRCDPLSASPPIVLFHGFLTRGKGAAVLLEAFVKLVEKGVDRGAELVIAGDTTPALPDRAFKEKLVARAGSGPWAPRVRFFGFVDDGVRDDLLKRARCLVVPYAAERDPGSASGVLLRGLAAGTPIIASDIPSLSEYVVDGESALLVPPGNSAALADAMGRLLTDTELAKKLGWQGRSLARSRYAWAAVAPQLMEIYRACAREDRAARISS